MYEFQEAAAIERDLKRKSYASSQLSASDSEESAYSDDQVETFVENE